MKHSAYAALLVWFVAEGEVIAQEEKPIEIANRVCLFLDDHFLAEQSGLKRTWHQGRPRPGRAVGEPREGQPPEGDQPPRLDL